MGLIKEPLGIDFYVDPKPLSDEERIKISEYILQYKKSHKRKDSLSSNIVKKVTENSSLEEVPSQSNTTKKH